MQLEDHSEGNDLHRAVRVFSAPSTSYQQVRLECVGGSSLRPFTHTHTHTHTHWVIAAGASHSQAGGGNTRDRCNAGLASN